MHKPAILALALLAVPAMALAESQAPLGGSDSIVIAATCDDLRAEVRASHPDCQPLRQTRPAQARPEVAPPAPARSVVVAVETQRPAERRRMARLPWLIGVYN